MVDLGFLCRFTKPPSYLKELLKNDEEICLVHNKKVKVQIEECVNNSNEQSVSSEEQAEGFDMSNLDLTGCPLQVDLRDDSLQTTLMFDRPNNWTTDEEVNHIPITLSQARQFINNYNKKKPVPPVYCVCDGTDKKQTVILGAKVSGGVFMRCQVFVVGLYPFGHHNLSIDYMREKHLKNVEFANANVQYKVTSTFGIYGYNMHNCDAFVNIEHRGSILMEVSWNKCEYEIPKTKADYQITLQIIVGHVDSHLSVFWAELNFLDYCINISKQIPLESVKLNTSGDSLEELTDSIFDLMKSGCYRIRPRPRIQQQQKDMSLDFNHLRDANIIDDLWNILRKSQTVSDLRSCLHCIFEHLAVSDSKLHIPEDNNSTFAEIMRGIYNGKLAVPTLSFQESLELLLELGLEKLKNDYLCIINHFCYIPLPTLMADWNKISSVSSEHSKNVQSSRISMKPEHTRKTRMTFNFGTSENEVLNSGKLKHLARMHVIIEFVLLVEDHSEFPRECYQHILEYACNKYMAPNSPIQSFSAVQKNRLYDLTMAMNCVNASVIKNKIPVKWHIQMSSKYNNSMVTTIFLHSESPIFPSIIFNNYDLSFSGKEEKLHYAIELIQYIDFFK